VPRNLGLIDFQNFDKETDAYLVFADRLINRKRVLSASALKRKAMLSSLLAMRLFYDVPATKYYDFEPPGVPFST